MYEYWWKLTENVLEFVWRRIWNFHSTTWEQFFWCIGRFVDQLLTNKVNIDLQQYKVTSMSSWVTNKRFGQRWFILSQFIWQITLSDLCWSLVLFLHNKAFLCSMVYKTKWKPPKIYFCNQVFRLPNTEVRACEQHWRAASSHICLTPGSHCDWELFIHILNLKLNFFTFFQNGHFHWIKSTLKNRIHLFIHSTVNVPPIMGFSDVVRQSAFLEQQISN